MNRQKIGFYLYLHFMLLVEYKFGFHITWITARNVIGIGVQCQTSNAIGWR